MTHDAKRLPGQAPERHAIGITRTCLASGTVQLPFALTGALPEGELLVRDVETDEGLVLWSDPPRRLVGLGPFFERHELQVNDAVVLEIDGDELRLSTSKRPRRSRPAVQPSTWHSLRDDTPRNAAEATPEVDDTASEDASASAATPGVTATEVGATDTGPTDTGPDTRPPDTRPTDAEPTDAAWTDGLWTGERPTDALPTDPPPSGPMPSVRSDVDAAPSAARRTHASDSNRDPFSDDDMPRAPRVNVRPLASDAGATAPSGRPVRPSDAAGARTGPLGRLGRFARALFRGGSGGRDAADGAAQGERARPDWTRAWDEEEDDDEVAPGGGFVGDTPTRQAFDASSEDGAVLTPRTPQRKTRPEDASHTAATPLAFDHDPVDHDPVVHDAAVDGAAVDDKVVDDEVVDDEAIDDVAAIDNGAVHAAPTDAATTNAADDVETARSGTPEETLRHVATPDPRASDAAASDVNAGATPYAAPGPDVAPDRAPDGPPGDEDDVDIDVDLDQAPNESTPATADGATPLFPEAIRGAPPRRPTDETPSGVPARAERFLGGDLRTRLLRYLESPEMGSVAQAEKIAKRFNLDPETAGEMLADIADDPPGGLRLRPVRDGAWRIERTPLR